MTYRLTDIKELKPRITVFGVGGAGGNAVNNMIESGLVGCEFVVANTDAQALSSAKTDRIIQMGLSITQGLGAGSHPAVGRDSAEEVVDEIREYLSGSHMCFITAGMGGGTGTGAAPVIAKIAREMGILTVGVVTKPFQFEGVRRMRIAEAGIQQLEETVDTLIVIPNQNLFRVANEKTTFADAFAMADQVLYSGVACITDLMVKEGLINLDFADVRSVMHSMGRAMMGTGEASGEDRANRAADAAIANPLLDDVSMKGARGLLVSITGGNDLTLYEVDEAASRIREEVDSEANIILGATFDESLDGIIRVSVVATGIEPLKEGTETYSHTTDHIIQEDSPALEVHSTQTRYESVGMLETDSDGRREASARFSAALLDEGKPSALHQGESYQVQTQAARTEQGVLHQASHTIQESYHSQNGPSSLGQKPQLQVQSPFIPSPPIVPTYSALNKTEGKNYAPSASVDSKDSLVPREMRESPYVSDMKRMSLLQRLATVGFGQKKDDKSPEANRAEHDYNTTGTYGENPIEQMRQYAEMHAPRNFRTTSADASAHVKQKPKENDDHFEIPAFLRRQAN